MNIALAIAAIALSGAGLTVRVSRRAAGSGGDAPGDWDVVGGVAAAVLLFGTGGRVLQIKDLVLVTWHGSFAIW